MPDVDGLEVLRHARSINPSVIAIMVTAYGSPDLLRGVAQLGVNDYVEKPFNTEVLRFRIRKELDRRRLQQENVLLKRAMHSANRFENIIGNSRPMQEVFELVETIAQTASTVLITGESGTGKELIARAIHVRSPRSERPFVAVNCGAIPGDLLESELFGHTRGAFTGAIQAHKGLFQAADGGTLFLDEIGDMPLPLQVKLLRVLQEGEVRPVGSTQAIPVDVRVISATHRDLDSQRDQGLFREDLYYRLNVVSLKLPSLADRREDIPLLAAHILRRLAERYRKPAPSLAPDATALLIAAPWPGNVRQLLNLLEQAVALTTTPVIPATLVQAALKEDAAALIPFEEARKTFEREYLVRLLKITGGNVTQAAQLAKRNRTEFYKLLQRHRLEPGMFKEAKT
jgi:two-component system response regulator GlrR